MRARTTWAVLLPSRGPAVSCAFAAFLPLGAYGGVDSELIPGVQLNTTAMTELVKGLVRVRDALTLIAFLSLVPLMAFRTPKVPELFFGLVRDKLTRQEFSHLLRRFMILGFVAFLTLAALALVAQVLNSRTQPGALTIDDLRRELSKLQAPAEQKLRAESNFATGIELMSKQDFDGAITFLQKSLEAIPTLSAQETLAFLYRQKRDCDRANASWDGAMKIARERGDSLEQARLDRILTRRSSPSQSGENDLIGNSTQMPKGGDRFETAREIAPGFYNCNGPEGCSGRFKVWLRGGQGLHVRLRSGDGGNSARAEVVFFDTNGQRIGAVGECAYCPSNNIYTADWTAQANGWHFIAISAIPGSVYRISTRD
jgi:hypothetical protein